MLREWNQIRSNKRENPTKVSLIHGDDPFKIERDREERNREERKRKTTQQEEINHSSPKNLEFKNPFSTEINNIRQVKQYLSFE